MLCTLDNSQVLSRLGGAKRSYAILVQPNILKGLDKPILQVDSMFCRKKWRYPFVLVVRGTIYILNRGTQPAW